MEMPQSRYPVNPVDVEGLELPSGWAGLQSKDVGHLNRIIRSLQHTHSPGSELQFTGGRFVSSDLDVPPGDIMVPTNWAKVSGPAEVDLLFGQPSIDMPKPGFVDVNAYIAIQAAGTNPIAVGDRFYAWLIPGMQQQAYLDIARITGEGGSPEASMHLHAVVYVPVGVSVFNVYFSPVIDAAGVDKTVRRGTSLELTAIY